jgi:hypothetical protein
VAATICSILLIRGKYIAVKDLPCGDKIAQFSRSLHRESLVQR